MLKYMLRRIIYLIPVVFAVGFLVCFLLYITPGDPAKAVLGEYATEETIKEFRTQQGLDDPFLIQYGRYMYKAIFKGDIGSSYVTKRPVTDEILSALPATVKLATFAMLLAVFIGIPCGIISAVKQYSLFDSITMVFALIGISMPVFWLGMLMILLFSVQLGWLPSSGFSSTASMILPSVALSAYAISLVTRMTRSSMLEVIRQDYIRTARAKGQKESVVILRHALGNALIPIITIVGLQFGYLLGGALLTETVFSIPGVGRLMVEGIKTRDYPLVQGGVFFIASAYCVVNLIVDLLYAYVDPRIRSQFK